ncbi:MAG TPA: hypothetical protein VH165_07480 [Kofleriaceae bacterium]|jgi:predicted NodU family carbamoyl transferase|nr:hypothetical protein [Kofleriaceae bacterium]
MILGLGGLDHNGAACLVDGGEVLAMLELERVTRQKNQGLDARNALVALLDRLGVGSVQHVAVADRTWAAAAAPWLTSHFGDRPLSIYSHHACHLAAAFAASPLPHATVVAVDGKGDGLSSSADRATREQHPDLFRQVPRLVDWMATVTGAPRAALRSPGKAHEDMAASVQQVTEMLHTAAGAG